MVIAKALFPFVRTVYCLGLIFFGRVLAWISSGSSNEELVTNLRNNHVIISDEVANAMLSVDRGFFVLSNAYVDSPQKIGYSATISAPHMHAHALEALRSHLRPGAHVLDVGSGSGYLTACIAVMVGQRGVVLGIDHIKELTQFSISNTKKWLQNAPAMRNSSIRLGVQIKLVTGDGRLGWPQEAPYDAIHVGAAADRIPKALLQQLKIGGRMIVPHGKPGNQWLVQVDRTNETSYTQSKLMPVMYVPLTDLSLQWQQRPRAHPIN